MTPAARIDSAARGEPREGRVGDVDVGDLGQHFARARAREHQHAILRRHLVDAHAAVGRQELQQRIVIMRLQRAGGDEIETVAARCGSA